MNCPGWTWVATIGNCYWTLWHEDIFYVTSNISGEKHMLENHVLNPSAWSVNFTCCYNIFWLLEYIVVFYLHSNTSQVFKKKCFWHTSLKNQSLKIFLKIYLWLVMLAAFKKLSTSFMYLPSFTLFACLAYNLPVTIVIIWRFYACYRLQKK